jgi:hypothetical protein
VATAAALVLAAVTVAGTIGWALRDRGARREAAGRQAQLAVTDSTGFIGEAKWDEALEALKRAEGRGAEEWRIQPASARARADAATADPDGRMMAGEHRGTCPVARTAGARAHA